MKSAVAFCLSFIHVIALSVVASEIANDHHWNGALVVLAWLVGGFLGLFPIIRSLSLLVLVFVALPWYKAIWVGPLAMVILGMLNVIGTKIARDQAKIAR